MRKKQGFPQEGEIVFCTVTKIFGHSVFVNIDEYDRQGMVHISEISPGRIRNLRDYVVEGKKIICVVLKVTLEKGHIDLSLRRVGENQRRKKADSLKQEQKSEKILENVAKELHKENKQFYEDVFSKISKEYDSLASCFTAIVKDEANLVDLGIEKDAAKRITEIVKDRMKPSKAIISGELSMKSYAHDGIEIIKSALKKAEDAGKDNISIRYAGGGSFKIVITADDYKQAEKILKECLDPALEFMEDQDAEAKFKRIEKKDK